MQVCTPEPHDGLPAPDWYGGDVVPPCHDALVEQSIKDGALYLCLGRSIHTWWRTFFFPLTSQSGVSLMIRTSSHPSIISPSANVLAALSFVNRCTMSQMPGRFTVGRRSIDVIMFVRSSPSYRAVDRLLASQIPPPRTHPSCPSVPSA